MLVTGIFAVTATSSSAAAAPRCTHAQLTVALGTSGQAAAGSFGIPFVITNTSTATCSLHGYPHLGVFTVTPAPKTIHVVEAASMIYAQVPPRIVNVAPGHTASFGVGGVDAMDQQYGNRPACTVSAIAVALPLSGVQAVYRVPTKFNICFSGFSVTVSSIQAGSAPKVR